MTKYSKLGEVRELYEELKRLKKDKVHGIHFNTWNSWRIKIRNSQQSKNKTISETAKKLELLSEKYQEHNFIDTAISKSIEQEIELILY